MADIHTPEQRRRNMAAVRAKNTKPEMTVRRMVHSMGYRYRLHHDDLPGKPDLVFPRLQKVVFVHGCYWHMHTCPRGRSKPRSNARFWREKLKTNVRRDEQNIAKLNDLGWKSFVVWECELKKTDIEDRIRSFLES